MKNNFRNKKLAAEWCVEHCPKPYTSNEAAVWVADRMNEAAKDGRYGDYDRIRDWAIDQHIDYDNAYVNTAFGRMRLTD